MTTPRRTARRTKLEKRRQDVIALIVEGKGSREIARIIGCARDSVHSFQARHAEEIDALRRELEQRVEAYAITKQVNRIRDAQLRRDLLDQVRESRASGGTGMETGIVLRQYKTLGSGEFAETVEEYKVDTAFLAEWRANDKQVAEELGQIQQPAPNINIDNRTQILVREYGVDLKRIG